MTTKATETCQKILRQAEELEPEHPLVLACKTQLEEKGWLSRKQLTALGRVKWQAKLAKGLWQPLEY